MSDVAWLDECVVDGRVSSRTGRGACGPVVEWPSVGRFTVKHGRGEFEPFAGASEHMVLKVRRGVVNAYERYLRGALSLHGGAAARNGRALVMIGPHGTGKSTAVATLCDRRGFLVLADDAVAIDHTPSGYAVAPTDTQHWLREDACRLLDLPAEAPKTPFDPVAVAPPTPLSAIVSLAVGAGAPRVERVPGYRAVYALLEASFRLPMGEPARDARELDLAATLCEAVPVFALTRATSTPVDLVADLLESVLERSS